MKRRTAGRVYHQRECAYCHGGIAETRPVYLVTTAGGKIVGPYHAGCAEKVTLRSRAKYPPYPEALEDVERFGQVPREETLPW